MYRNIRSYKYAYNYKGKGNVHPRIGHKGSEGAQRHNYSSFNFGARLGWVVKATPRPPYSRKDKRYLLYKKMGGPQELSGRARKISSPPGYSLFILWTKFHVARMQSKFCRSWPHHIRSSAGSSQTCPFYSRYCEYAPELDVLSLFLVMDRSSLIPFSDNRDEVSTFCGNNLISKSV